MKRTLLVAGILLTTIFAFASPVRADHWRGGWGFGFGFGSGGVRVGGSYYRPARHYRACNHRPIPIYTRVWVAPVYRTIFSGYDPCGRPIYRRIVTCRGYWQNVVSGYRCGLCSASCG